MSKDDKNTVVLAEITRINAGDLVTDAQTRDLLAMDGAEYLGRVQLPGTAECYRANTGQLLYVIAI